MHQPSDFEDSTNPHYVCKLHKALYGLKQSPRAWFSCLCDKLYHLGFHSSKADMSLFILHNDAISIYILLYVDDIVNVGSSQTAVDRLIHALSSSFPIKDLRRLNYFLGIEVLHNSGGITLVQQKYASDLLRHTNMENCKGVSTPMLVTDKLARDSGKPLNEEDTFKYRSMVGGLQYLSLTRPDISFPINKVYQYLSKPTNVHWEAIGPDAWIIEDLLESILKELGVSQTRAPVLWCDNLETTYLTANPVFHAKTKHIEVDFHFVKEKVAMGALDVWFISSNDQVADGLTKPTTRSMLEKLRYNLNLVTVKIEGECEDKKRYVVPTGRVVVPTSRYIVPTGRVVVPTGRYVVPASKVIIIVSPGRLSLVSTSRVLSPVSNNNAKFSYLKKDEYEVWAIKMEYWITNNDMNIWKVIQNGNSLKRTGRDRDGRVIILPPTTADEHIAVQRESKARTTLLQSIPDDHVADFHYMDDARDIWNAVKARFGGNAESKKMRKSMLKQEFSEFRISEAEGLHKGYDRMQKILSQLNQLKAKPEDEDINLKFLRALPSSWSQVALTLKTKGGLELLSFDDLYYKLKTLEVDIKGYSTFSSSQSAGPSHSAFVSTTSASKKMSYADSPSYSSSTYTAPSNSKTGSHRSGNVIEDVLQSFVADTEPEQQLAYEDFEQIEKMDLEEMDLKWQMAMLSVRVHKFEQKAGRKIDFDKKESARFNKKKVRCYKCLQRGHFARECRAKGGNDKQRYSSFKIQEIGKKEEDSKALITVDTLVDWTEHDGQSDGVIAPKEFGMIAGCDTEDAIEEGAAKIYNLITGADTKEASTAGDAGEFALMGVTSEVHNCPFGCDNKYNELQKQHNELNEQNSEYFIQVQAYKNSLKTLEKQKRVLQKNQLTLEDKIRVLSIELENTTNLLKHSERINAIAETAKKELQTKLDNHLVQIEKWRTSSKNLFRLIDSSMSVRTKVGLGFNNYIRENELGWDDSAFSVFTTNSEEVEGRPLFNRFAKADSMKAVPPPLSGDYTPLSDHIDLDESQMSYGTKSSTSGDSNSVSNDFVSCDNSDKSSEVNTNDFASSDSSVKSLEPKSNDLTSCASTSSVSTSESEAEIESNVGTPIQEPIIVQDLPSFSCNSSDKNENTSRTSCNKNGYFNKKAGHFRKNASSVSKLCFVCGSSTHLIKDCDFYEKQMANKAVGNGVGPVHSRNNVNHQNQFIPQAVLLRTGKVNIPPASPQPVPTGKPKVPTPVPTSRQNRPFLVPTDRGYSPSVTSGWWKSTARPMKYGGVRWATTVKPSADAEDEGIFDSGCSRSMTGNMERLDDFQEFQGGKELQQFNLFSISQICDKKNRVLFTDTDCLVLSKDFMLLDESMVVLRVQRKHNLYTINLNNLSPRGNLACLVAKASVDKFVKWHRRMGHVNYKNMNRLVKGNLVRGLPPKLFKNDHTCVACCKGKQHKASYKAITAVSSISEPLQLLHMDLFGPTSIRSIDHKYYCLVITDDYSRFCWVFFLEHKDETYPILKDFINLVENQLNKKVKAIRCDNGTEFKNAHIIELCGSKGIKRDYSNARTPQQNGVAERKNRTLIEAARTMLADSKLPTMFWTEAVRTACYVLNRVLVTSPHNKTPYALLTGNIPSVSHFKPFGCHVTILNTSDHLGKFDGKADEGYIVGYSASNRAYRVYNVPNKRVEETMNLKYLEKKPNVQGLGHEWYFNLDYLTDTLGYKRDKANQSTGTHEASTNPAGTQDADSDSECDEQVIIVPSYASHSIQVAEPKDTSGDEVDDSPLASAKEIFQQELARLKVPPGSIPVSTGSIPVPSGDTTFSPGDLLVPTGGVPVPTGSPTDSFFDDEPTTRFPSPSDLRNNEPSPGIFSFLSYDDEFGADLNNLASTVEVSPVATKRINTIHPQSLIIGDHTSSVQMRSKVNKNTTSESAFIIEPRSVAQALEDPSWVDAMQEEMQQFKFQNVWVLIDLPEGKYAIRTKWILKNKRDARGIVVRNKARLVVQGHRQEEGIDYHEVFALVARIEAIRLFLAFAFYMGFMVYQMDVKSAFLYGRIDEEVYVTQRKGFVDPQHPKKVYKHKRDIILVQVYVDDIIFGSTKKAWCDEFEALMKGKFEMSAMGELTFFLGLQVQQRPAGIYISQDKYVQEILKKFDLECVRTATTPYEAQNPKSKNEPDSPVNVHLYRSMIGSLIYLTASRPDIMFAVSACLRNQVIPTTSNLEAVKKIFKYLKGQPRLGLWYPRESPFVLEAYSDSDYAGANKDRKSTTGGCQFLGRRLISWQCKKQTIVATSSTEAEYVAAANCCGQTNGSRGSSVPSGVTRVPTGSFHFSYWLTTSYCYGPFVLLCWSPELGPPAILATIDETPYTITEDSVRSQLQLADDGGIDDLPIAEIYSWNGTSLVVGIQFGSSLAVALICLSDGRKFNWSSYIFKGMVSNIGNAKKFLMYPRFLQTILGIETSLTRQYQVFKLSSKLFANMKLNFEGQPMQLLAAMLPQDQEGEGAGVAAQAVPPPIPEPIPEPMPEPDQPQDHLSTPPRQQTSDPIDKVEDEPLGGSFHASPPRSTQAPPAGHTSGGAEDLITLTVVSSVVSTLVQKVNSLETELKDTKKLFKDVVGKLVKKVKAMEVKLKTKKRKVVVSDSDQEEGGEQDVDLDALLALANAAVIVDSNIPPGGASSSHIPTDVPTGVAPVGVSNKGKTPMVEEDIIVKERTLKQMEDDRLGEEAAKRLHDEEQAQVDRQRAELNRRRQQDVLASAMYYTKADWINIMAQVEANASPSKTLLGDDVTEDNFPIGMAALIKRKKQALAEKLAKERMERPMTLAKVESFTDAQLNEEFEKILSEPNITFTSLLKQENKM
ncbi:putative ribonuclease H-like domain-containing protein, partial [Tanacetum coccineum]